MVHLDRWSEKLKQFETFMTVLKPRSRMISVRLSEEEYSSFKRLCSEMGARSISDLARDSMCALLNGLNREDVHSITRSEFRTQMKMLDRKLEQLAASIKSTNEDRDL
jgi:hypothetical protein